MKVLVCGGRKYSNMSRIFCTLNAIHAIRPILEVIEGGATGADSIAGNWAKMYGEKLTVVLPDYRKHDPKVAPLIRNSQMAELNPDLLIAFPGGSGTADMIKKAKARHIPILEIGE